MSVTKLLQVLVIGVVLVGLMLWLAGVFHGGKIAPGTAAAGEMRWTGPVATAKAESAERSEPFEGTVISVRTTLLSPRVGGPLVELRPRVGDTVVAGQPYGRIESTVLAARVAVAEGALDSARRSQDTATMRVQVAERHRASELAGLDLAKKQFDRIKALSQSASVTESELDVTTTRLRQAETADAEALLAIDLAGKQVAEAQGLVTLRERELALARTDQIFAEMKSEVGGIVVRRLSEPGSFAQPGVPVLEIYDPQDLRLEVPVRETLAAAIDRTRNYRVTFPALAMTVDGRVVEVVPSADPASRSILVRLSVPPVPGLLPGMSGAAEVQSGRRSVVTVPLAAIIRIGQLTYADVAQSGVIDRRFVRCGAPIGADRIEVLDGVRDGETVAVHGGADSRGR